MFPVPTRFFLTSGVGVHRERLTAFELALRDADIEQQNLVSVSSILPPHCEQIEREDGVGTLRPGEITFCVMARAETNEPSRRIQSSIGLARPTDPAMYGYISEHHGYGMTREESGDYAEDLAATMLASTLGIEFDPEAAWNERKRVYQTSNLIIGSTSLTAAVKAMPRDVGRVQWRLRSSASNVVGAGRWHHWRAIVVRVSCRSQLALWDG
jgi:arginine decarboxylase